MTLQEAFRKLGDARDEFHAAKFALQHTFQAYGDAPLVYESGYRQQITLGDLETCAHNLQITYFVRLFAEFEGILRDYWLNGRQRESRPPLVDLLNSLAAYCAMNADDVQNAHEVRHYRNDVIHNHLQDPRLDFQTCFSRMASFIRWLPRHW